MKLHYPKSKQNNRRISALWSFQRQGEKSFVCFLENGDSSRFTFDISWPLWYLRIQNKTWSCYRWNRMRWHIIASINPKCDDRLFFKLCTSLEQCQCNYNQTKKSVVTFWVNWRMNALISFQINCNRVVKIVKTTEMTR